MPTPLWRPFSCWVLQREPPPHLRACLTERMILRAAKGFENRRHLLRLWLTSTVNTHAIDPERECGPAAFGRLMLLSACCEGTQVTS